MVFATSFFPLIGPKVQSFPEDRGCSRFPDKKGRTPMPLANGAVQCSAASCGKEPPLRGPPRRQKARPIGELTIPRFGKRRKCSTITTTATAGASHHDKNGVPDAATESAVATQRPPGITWKPGDFFFYILSSLPFLLGAPARSFLFFLPSTNSPGLRESPEALTARGAPLPRPLYCSH